MEIDAVIARLRDGDVIRMEIVEGERHWWFEQPDQIVPATVMSKVRRVIKIRERKDSLFKISGDSQTWVAVKPRQKSTRRAS